MVAGMIEEFGEGALLLFFFALIVFALFYLAAISKNNQISEDDQIRDSKLASVHGVMLLFLIGCAVGWLLSGKALGYKAWMLLLMMSLLSFVGLVDWKAFLRLKRRKSERKLRSIDWKAFANVKRCGMEMKEVAVRECGEGDR
jgi:apolipoprotein N-acyltransferase